MKVTRPSRLGFFVGGIRPFRMDNFRKSRKAKPGRPGYLQRFSVTEYLNDTNFEKNIYFMVRKYCRSYEFVNTLYGAHIMLSTVLLILLILLLIGAIPSWPYSTGWGYGPSGLIGVILLIVIILLLTGRI